VDQSVKISSYIIPLNPNWTSDNMFVVQFQAKPCIIHMLTTADSSHFEVWGSQTFCPPLSPGSPTFNFLFYLHRRQIHNKTEICSPRKMTQLISVIQITLTSQCVHISQNVIILYAKWWQRPFWIGIGCQNVHENFKYHTMIAISIIWPQNLKNSEKKVILAQLRDT